MKYVYKQTFFLLIFLMSIATPGFVCAVINQPDGIKNYAFGGIAIHLKKGDCQFTIFGSCPCSSSSLAPESTMKEKVIGLHTYGDDSSKIVEGALSSDGQRVAILSSYGTKKEQFLWIGEIDDESLSVDWTYQHELSQGSSEEEDIKALNVKFERDNQTVQVLYESGHVFAHKEEGQEPASVVSGNLFNSHPEPASSFVQENESSSTSKDIPDQSDQDVKNDHKDTSAENKSNNDAEKVQKKVPSWLQNRMMRVLGIGTVALGGTYLVYRLGKYVVDKFKKKNENQEHVEEQKQDKKPKGEQDETVSSPAKKKWFLPYIKWIYSESN